MEGGRKGQERERRPPHLVLQSLFVLNTLEQLFKNSSSM